SPVAGAVTTSSVRGKVTAPVVVRLRSPRRTSVRLRLRRVSRTLWRGTYTFAFPGTWRLAFRTVTRYVKVGPYPESTLVPPGAPGCSPPSPATITREARGPTTAPTGSVQATSGAPASYSHKPDAGECTPSGPARS